jgi:peroxiredoxin
MLSTTTLALVLSIAAAPPEASRLGEGEKAPVFKLRKLDQELFKLDEVAYAGKEKSWAKKRPILIDFFRTDCGPCMNAMPELVQIYKDYKDKGLEVLLIALLEEDNGRAKLEAYLGKSNLPFPVVVDETEHVAKKYLGPTAPLPSTFLIDREGTIRRTKHKAGSMREHFQAALDRVVKGE